jgi:hypothetical protein
MSRARPELRKRGEIEERNGSLRVKVYAGLDPVLVENAATACELGF